MSLEQNLYPLGQLLGAAYYGYRESKATTLTDHQQRRLNAYFKQPNGYINNLEFDKDGYSIICRCETVDIYYKHSPFMTERVVDIRTNI